MTTNHVLCPIDGSPASARALHVAAESASALGVPLRIFTAVEDPHEIAAMRAQIEFQVAAVDAPEIEVDVTVAPHAPKAIVAFAGGDAQVVMAATTRQHMLTGYLGSATEQVIRAVHRPVLTVGPNAEHSLDGVTRVIVPCDGSAESEAALPFGREWADLLDVDLEIVSVLEPSTTTGNIGESNYVRSLGEQFSAQWDVLHGTDVAKAITDHASDALIVMSTHGRSGFSRMRMGSVAIETTRQAKGPVAIVAPAQTTTEPSTAEAGTAEPIGRSPGIQSGMGSESDSTPGAVVRT